MKIAIVGGGISGLATYLFLVRELPSHDYVIYEAYETPRKKIRGSGTADSDAQLIGGGIGVAPNGMKVLRDLDPKIHADIVAQGFPTARIQFKNSRGWILGAMPTVDTKGKDPEAMIMTSRQGVWEILRDRVPDDVFHHVAIAKVEDGPDGKPVITHRGGDKEAFDLVIGADGVRSVVRVAILGDEHAAYYT